MEDQHARQYIAGSIFTAMRSVTVYTVCGNRANISKQMSFCALKSYQLIGFLLYTNLANMCDAEDIYYSVKSFFGNRISKNSFQANLFFFFVLTDKNTLSRTQHELQNKINASS